VAKSRLPALIVRWRSDGRGSFLGLVLFRFVSPPLQLRGVGLFSGTRCVISQPFSAGGNQSYLEFWVVTSGPRYPEYLP
jgi:hypothetical protein